jgi:hypothetical protein
LFFSLFPPNSISNLKIENWHKQVRFCDYIILFRNLFTKIKVRKVRCERKFLLKNFGNYFPKLTFQGQKQIFGRLKRGVGVGWENFKPKRFVARPKTHSDKNKLNLSLSSLYRKRLILVKNLMLLPLFFCSHGVIFKFNFCIRYWWQNSV